MEAFTRYLLYFFNKISTCLSNYTLSTLFRVKDATIWSQCFYVYLIGGELQIYFVGQC